MTLYIIIITFSFLVLFLYHYAVNFLFILTVWPTHVFSYDPLYGSSLIHLEQSDGLLRECWNVMLCLLLQYSCFLDLSSGLTLFFYIYSSSNHDFVFYGFM